MTFPNSLIANYQNYQNISLCEDEDEEDHEHREAQISGITPLMTAMFNLQMYLVCGSAKGNLHFGRSSALYLEQNAIYEQIKREKMAQFKSYAAHTSFISQCEVHSNKEILLTTGISDETIM
jgi:hypothetical protein